MLARLRAKQRIAQGAIDTITKLNREIGRYQAAIEEAKNGIKDLKEQVKSLDDEINDIREVYISQFNEDPESGPGTD